MKHVSLIIVILALCAFATPSLAGSDVGFRAVGANLSLVDPDGATTALGVGVIADLGMLGNRVNMETYAGYWKKSESFFGTEVSLRDFAVGARAKYMFPISSRTVHPYAGGGLGVHFVSAGVDVQSFDFGGFATPSSSFSDSEVKLGLDLGGGTLIDVSPNVSLLGDLWFTAVSDINQFQFRAGVVYKIGGNSGPTTSRGVDDSQLP